MKLTYLSHSCFLLETSTHRLLIDPFLSGNPLAQVKPEEIECDYILVSHGHFDHLGDTVAIAERTGATVIANFEIAQWCAAKGKGKVTVHPMNHGGAWRFPFGRVKLTVAHHSSGIEGGEAGEFIYLGEPAGLLITADGATLYHAGDTALFSDMKLIGELDTITVAMLPIGDNFTMGPEDAARAAAFLNAPLAIPMHYNTFEMIALDPQRFVDASEGRGRVLAIGEGIEI